MTQFVNAVATHIDMTIEARMQNHRREQERRARRDTNLTINRRSDSDLRESPSSMGPRSAAEQAGIGGIIEHIRSGDQYRVETTERVRSISHPAFGDNTMRFNELNPRGWRVYEYGDRYDRRDDFGPVHNARATFVWPSSDYVTAGNVNIRFETPF